MDGPKQEEGDHSPSGTREKTRATEMRDCDGETLWRTRLIAAVLGFGGLTSPALLCSAPCRPRKQPRLASIVRGSARQVPRWAEASGSMASGQTFSPVQQGANARWSPPADRWTNGYTQDVWSARRRRWRWRGAAKQLFTAMLSLSDWELEA